jgi:hypothetical protein
MHPMWPLGICIFSSLSNKSYRLVFRILEIQNSNLKSRNWNEETIDIDKRKLKVKLNPSLLITFLAK